MLKDLHLRHICEQDRRQCSYQPLGTIVAMALPIKGTVMSVQQHIHLNWSNH